IAPLVYGKVTYLLHRLLMIVPSFQVIVLVCGSLIARAKRAALPLKAAAAILLFLWIQQFVLPGRGAVVEAVRSISFDHMRGGLAPSIREAVEKASRVIPDKSVVVSDPITSYALSAYNNVDVVSVLHQHGNPNDPLVMDRLIAARDVLSPFVSQKESLKHLERFRVEYIVINGGFNRPVREFMACWSPEFLGAIREKFYGPEDNFKIVYDSPDVVVVRVLGYYCASERWLPTVPFLSAGADGIHPCARSVSGGGAVVRGVSVAPQEVRPGETVRLTIQYEKDLAVEPVLPVALIVRFDNAERLSRYASYPGGKYLRRMKERVGGYLSRYRTDRMPFDGLYPPDMWPLGAPAAEEVQVTLPPSLADGAYDIQLKLVEDSLLPNFSVRDFLYNEDSYSSVSCGRIDVKASLVR
ncbi:MAG: hypothetical protein HY770_08635, partial [Chitinivibrionia bacterium]|nr:hypothetical protein [Chitinivibrionia bacterium]